MSDTVSKILVVECRPAQRTRLLEMLDQLNLPYTTVVGPAPALQQIAGEAVVNPPGAWHTADIGWPRNRMMRSRRYFALFIPSTMTRRASPGWNLRAPIFMVGTPDSCASPRRA